ncbi:MAG: hypothetical protein Q8S00_20475, partial [Deltaproteobacteria bacterium]|nr:hypothetical protein [Deltaproteobacteria bacterium]
MAELHLSIKFLKQAKTVAYSTFDKNILALLLAGILAAGCGTMSPPSPPTSFPTGGPATSGTMTTINRGLVI